MGVGLKLGFRVGILVGGVVGGAVGLLDGLRVGIGVGRKLGLGVEMSLGAKLGPSLGLSDFSTRKEPGLSMATLTPGKGIGAPVRRNVGRRVGSCKIPSDKFPLEEESPPGLCTPPIGLNPELFWLEPPMGDEVTRRIGAGVGSSNVAPAPGRAT